MNLDDHQVACIERVLREAERGLRGEYPWLINSTKYSQKEARAAALKCVQQFQKDFANFKAADRIEEKQ